MESCCTSFLCYTCDRLLYFFFISTHHEVSELIYDDDYYGHCIFIAYFRVILFEISSIDSLKYSESSFHFCYSPLEGIECFIGSIYHRSEQVWDTIIDSELDLLRIDHDHTEFAWSILIEK